MANINGGDNVFGWIENLISNTGIFSTLFAFIPTPMLAVLISAVAVVLGWFCVKLIIELLVSLK